MSRHECNLELPRGAVTVILAGLLLAAGPAPAFAHEDAVLTTAHSTAAAGDSLQLAGREFSEGKEYALKLVGPLRAYPLGSVRADSAGRFLSVVAIPRDVLSGFYQVTATADDGDIVARADLAVMSSGATDEATASGASARDRGAAPGMSETHGMPVGHAGRVDLDRDRGGIEWVVIGLLIGGSAILGLWSLTRAGRDVASSGGGGGDQGRNDVLTAAPKI